MKGILTLEEGKQLIYKVQKGIASKVEERKLIEEFRCRYRPHQHINYLYDQNELESEYLLASWNTIFRAKLDIGDPISFCVRRGYGAMLDYYRKISSDRLILICPLCGSEYTYDRRNKNCKNKFCTYTGELESREKEEIIDFESDINKDLSIKDLFVNKIEVDETIDDIAIYLAMLEINSFDKKMAIESLKNRMDFYDYARYIGKSHSWSISFKSRIINILKPHKDKFIYCI